MAVVTLRYTLYICPDCGAWYPDTANGYPLYSGCEHLGRREAERVEVMPVAERERELADSGNLATDG